MDRPQLIRRLRIALSVFFAVLAVALCVLWALSYWRFAQLIRCITPDNYVACTSMQGQLVLGQSNDPISREVFKDTWTWRGFALADWDSALSSPVAYFPVSVPGPENAELVPLPRSTSERIIPRVPGAEIYELMLPYWLLALTATTISAVMSNRVYRLRALLIATTLVAVVLGLGVWATG